mmetsp:Transcript_13924/g.26725  ORF Transcript_13924/g.26725 Transcript_13924/m.26725 type:complete len:176 (+) Transcript_13924:161-688(+)
MLVGGGLNSPDNPSSRPFMLGLVLLIIFLSLQTDFSLRRPGHPGGRGSLRDNPVQHREVVKEKIILDLSVSNEKLEAENQRLRIDLYALQRQVRECRGNDTSILEGDFLSKAGQNLEPPPSASAPGDNNKPNAHAHAQGSRYQRAGSAVALGDTERSSGVNVEDPAEEEGAEADN